MSANISDITILIAVIISQLSQWNNLLKPSARLEIITHFPKENEMYKELLKLTKILERMR